MKIETIEILGRNIEIYSHPNNNKLKVVSNEEDYDFLLNHKDVAKINYEVLKSCSIATITIRDTKHKIKKRCTIDPTVKDFITNLGDMPILDIKERFINKHSKDHRYN